jgi:hypothetical protein
MRRALIYAPVRRCIETHVNIHRIEWDFLIYCDATLNMLRLIHNNFIRFIFYKMNITN